MKALRFDDVAEPLRDALSVHEALRRLGFAPDQIFVNHAPRGLQVVLRAQGLEFVIDVGPRNLSDEQYESVCSDRSFADRWAEAVALWNDGDDELGRQRVLSESPVLKVMGDLIARLLAKGFAVKPGGWN